MEKVASPKRKRKGDEGTIRRLRVGYLNRFFELRYGGNNYWMFPDDDAGREDLRILLDHLHPYARGQVIRQRAPWMAKQEAEDLLEYVEACPRKYKSATLGKLIGFRDKAWRQGLRLPTITPFGMTAGERREVILTEYKEKRRKMRKQKTRNQYLATNTISKDRPWVGLGMSRADWYRKGKPTQNDLRQVGDCKDTSSLTINLPVSNNCNSGLSATLLPSNSFGVTDLYLATKTKRPDQTSRAELEAIYAKKRKPPPFPWIDIACGLAA